MPTDWTDLATEHDDPTIIICYECRLPISWPISGMLMAGMSDSFYERCKRNPKTGLPERVGFVHSACWLRFLM